MTHITEIEKRLDGITKGPWKADDNGIEPESVPYIYVPVSEKSPQFPGVNGVSVLFDADWGTLEDADFIVHAPSDIAYLLEERKRMVALLTQAKGMFETVYLHKFENQEVRTDLCKQIDALLEARDGK